MCAHHLPLNPLAGLDCDSDLELLAMRDTLFDTHSPVVAVVSVVVVVLLVVYPAASPSPSCCYTNTGTQH